MSNLLPDHADDLSAMISDILTDRVIVWWCDGPDLSATLARAFARFVFDNGDDVAGVVVSREGLGVRFIHNEDKHVIVIEVETARIDKERGAV